MAAAGAEDQPRDEDLPLAARSEIRGSSVLLFGRVVALGINTLTQVLVVRALTKGDFGAFAYAMSMLTFARVAVGLGHNQATTRFFALYEERRDWGRLFGLLVMLPAVAVALGGLLFTAAWLVRDGVLLSLVEHRRTVDVVVVVLLLAPVEVVDDVLESAFAVFSRPQSIFVRKHLIGPLASLAVVVMLLLADAGVVFLAWGYVAAALVGLLFYAVTLRSVLDRRGLLPHAHEAPLRFPVREFYGFSIPLLTTEFVHISMVTVTVVVLGAVTGPEEVAEFRAIRPVALLNQVAYTTFALLFTPFASRLWERNDRSRLTDGYWQTAAWLVVISFPVLALTGPFATETTVFLFGDRYAASGPLLAILALGYYLNAALGFNALVLKVAGAVRWLVAANLAVASFNVLLALLLVSAWGAIGAAVANAATLVIQNVVNQIGLRRRLGMAAFDRRFARAYLSAAGGVVLLGAVSAASDPPLAAALALTVAAAAVVFAVNRRVLRVGSTFPELRGVPVIGRIVS